MVLGISGANVKLSSTERHDWACNEQIFSSHNSWRMPSFLSCPLYVRSCLFSALKFNVVQNFHKQIKTTHIITACCLFNVINLLLNEGAWRFICRFFCRIKSHSHTIIHSFIHSYTITHKNHIFCNVCLFFPRFLCVERSFCKFNNLINMYKMCILPSYEYHLSVCV